MTSHERKKEILKILMTDNNISIVEISELLKVSTVTIRSDLNALADEGFIVRVHGGAIPTFHKNIIERRRTMIEEKQRIAKAAADLVEDGDKIMIIAGTTAVMMVKYLLGKQDIQIVTNSTLILPFARINPSLHVTTIGGEFKPAIEGYIGPLALQNLEQFHVDKAFIGSDGFSLKGGVTANGLESAEVGRKMVEHSRECILLADSAKYGRAGFARIVPLYKMNKIITDNKLSNQAVDELQDFGINLELV